MEWLSKKEVKQLDAIRNTTEKYQKFDEIIGKKIVKGQLVNTNSLPFYLDAGFKRVLNKALNFHYEKRFNNTSMFLKEVHSLLRFCPDYIHEPDKLIVKHENGKEYQIYKNKKDEMVLEKRLSNKEWRKENNHNGTIESALKTARIK
jgi:hypothetical protein